ncbi:MAG: pilus assembly protein TadG-related protein, partial [Thermaerobacter sp.]|nr:pilus assembly protein TadG-related protein [Thermaerobacter sp.]
MRQRVWWRRRQGQALVIVALAMPLLIGMAGVGLTVGTVYYSQQKLQNAVDAGALAGAKALMMGDPNAPGDQAA